jgi:methylenetetrahydrofolate--tRNA-(uracil-5-)-methyltransferase
MIKSSPEMRNELNIIGGGLAGSEAAWQAAERGIKVSLFEMRPHVSTPVHHTGYLGEIICSNSLGSKLPDRASGLLQAELTLLRSFLLIAPKNALFQLAVLWPLIEIYFQKW